MAAPLDVGSLRSLLFTPGTRPERFAKAAASGADAVILDLEDAVPPLAKAEARDHVLGWLDDVPGDGVPCLVRVNGLRTPEGLRDLLAFLDAGVAPPAIVLPKVESLAELEVVAALLTGPLAATGFVPLIESARALSAAEAIASHPRTRALALGGADLAADLGCTMAWEPLLWARARVVQAAATAGVGAVDVPYLDLARDDGLADEAAAVRDLGFTGKLAIHPRHVAAINAALTPTADEHAQARRVVDAADAAGDGVCVVDGRMVDPPIVRAARRTLARARRASHT